MAQLPMIVAICGVKNSGKTTLIEALVSRLADMGKRVAVIKHDGHDFSCDLSGTDTYRCTQAGAFGAAAFSGSRIFVHRKGAGQSEKALLPLFSDADLILIEGLKDSDYRKIEVVRGEISRRTVSNPRGRFLIVSDLPEQFFQEERVGFDDIDTIIHRIFHPEDGKKGERGDAEL